MVASRQQPKSIAAEQRAAAAKTAPPMPTHTPFWGESLNAREDAERQRHVNACATRGTYWPFPLG
jgi:hypothetical protein